MFKKIIASFLALILLCSCTTTFAVDEAGEKTPQQTLLAMFESYASSITKEDFWQCCSVVGESKGAAVLYCGFKDPDFDYRIANYAAERFGDYLFTNDPCFIEDLHQYGWSYPLGIFVVKGQDAMPLDQAYHDGIIDIDEVAAMSFPDENVCIRSIHAELTNAQKLMLLYYDQCDDNDDFSCPLFSYFEDGQVDGYTICEFGFESYDIMFGYHPFYCGDYLLYDTDWYPYGPGMFAIKGDDIYTIDEAYDCGIFPTLEPIMEICRFDTAIKAGDYNEDGKISISDVLALQKYLARIIMPPYYSVRLCPDLIFDFDKNYSIDLKDVLAMQKKIVKAV